jgi:hypothetical protein
MPLILKLRTYFFGFKSYKKGLIIHLSFLFFYSFLFIGVYYLLRLKSDSVDLKAYHQVKLSQFLVLVMITHLLSLIYFRWNQFLNLIKEYFTEKGSPYNLAIFRMLFFFNLGGHFLYYTSNIEIAWTYLPNSSRVGLPFIGWLITNLPINPNLYFACSIIAGILCWLICIGVFTRYAIIVLLPFALYVLGVPMFYGKMSHYHILLWVPILFSLVPIADVWSIDAYIRKKKNIHVITEPHLKYFLPFKLLWLQLSIIYGFAGIIKLWDCGFDWALSDSMINQMRWEWVEHYDKVPDFRLDNYPVLAKIGGLCVIYFELLYFLLIIKPKGRIWAFMGTYALHRLCGYFMYIDFTNLRLVAASYINWQKITQSFKNKFSRTIEITEDISGDTLMSILKKEKVKIVFISGVIFISINFICSCFKIHSYPFSSYPTYSGIVKNEIKTIRMQAVLLDDKIIDVKLLGEKANFRWETIRPYEIRIAEAFNSNDSLLVKNKLTEYWQLWRNNVKGLEKVVRIDMYLETSSIIPEERHIILKSEFLTTIYPLEIIKIN